MATMKAYGLLSIMTIFLEYGHSVNALLQMHALYKVVTMFARNWKTCEPTAATGFFYSMRRVSFLKTCVSQERTVLMSRVGRLTDYQMFFFCSPCFSFFLLSHIHTQNWLSGQPPSFRPIYPQLTVFLPEVALELTTFQAGLCIFVTLCRQKVKRYCFVMITMIMIIIVNISTGQTPKECIALTENKN